METSRCFLRPLKCTSITLHRGCPLLPFLLDGLHHYPDIVCLCVLTGWTANTTVLGFMFPGSQSAKKKRKKKFCFGRKLLRLLCSWSAGFFDLGKVSVSDDFDNGGRFPKANESLLFKCLRVPSGLQGWKKDEAKNCTSCCGHLRQVFKVSQSPQTPMSKCPVLKSMFTAWYKKSFWLVRMVCLSSIRGESFLIPSCGLWRVHVDLFVFVTEF